MKKYILFLVFIFLALPFFVSAESLGSKLAGRLLLQVEYSGRIWYVCPELQQRFEVTFENAHALFRKKALGISNENLNKIPIDPAFVSDSLDSDNDGFSDRFEVISGYNSYGKGKIKYDTAFSNKLKGRFLLQVEDKGRVWYVDFGGQRVEVTFDSLEEVLKQKSLGITNQNLFQIAVGNIFDIKKIIMPIEMNNKIEYKVPFYSQAPTGNWSDSRQAYGCEETSVIMAMGWVNNEILTNEQVEKKIIEISDFELKKYREYHDTSIQDTYNWIIKDYYNYNDAFVIENSTPKDIIDGLRNNALVLAPVNGQVLKNPHYRGVGPYEHMVVVVGYDPDTDEFIIHDPGTQYGGYYRFDAIHFEKSLQDYETGFRLNKSKDIVSIIVINRKL